MECRRGLVITRNSSGDEIANVNFLYDDIVHVAYYKMLYKLPEAKHQNIAKWNLDDKFISNCNVKRYTGTLVYTRECVNLVIHTNFTVLRVIEADFWGSYWKLSGRRPEPSGHCPDAARSRSDAARVGRDLNPCLTVPIPSAAPGLSVVTVGWLLELNFKSNLKYVA